ncbi:MAG: PEP-CTERM sorting domain-containing protein [Verrucomicrobia bacterium]|nr:PEP-CTERM sorting domain-containing protein [Verrucomicrobiota bacterium]
MTQAQNTASDDVVALYGATYQGATVASNWNETFIAGFAIVPEPSTIGLVLLGCAAIGLRCRRR